MSKKKVYMGIDQYGQAYHGLRFPRKELQKQLPGKISKMFITANDGKTYHCGWVFGKIWVNIYEIIPMRREV